jgi:hypothetical protein
MRASLHIGAAAPGSVTPESDEARRQPGFPGVQGTADSVDFRSAQPAQQALQVIAGERRADDFLARLHAEQADPDELALIVAALYGITLRGFCRVLVKALRGVV